ncbi:MAG TPA: pilin [Lachnospiraceae bacterium]|nr:pilin [Lachnospiraceae bacterium]HBE08844.1 pilin [Lachnospiraceae bacterium]
MKRLNKKGFTLAELLIVVAIIAVLVAIAIPIFTSQLEKAREATDMANIRSAYAEVQTAALTEEDTGNAKISDDKKTVSETIKLKQQKEGWQTKPELAGNMDSAEGAKEPTGKKDQEVTITYTFETQKTTINLLLEQAK